MISAESAAPSAYRVPRPLAPVDLKLDANEGPPGAALPAIDVETLCRYPDAGALEAELARRFDIEAERVVVTAGGDDALLRACLAWIGPDRELVLPTPAFEMLERYAAQAKAPVRAVPERNGRFPAEEVLAAARELGDRLGLVAVVSPSNPTGSTATADELRRLSAELPDAVLLVDLAYAEFADEDLTEVALSLPNALCVRTLSKAWGLAGARVGWAMGPAPLVAAVRAAGSPFSVSAPSLALAARRLETGADDVRAYVEAVHDEREALRETLLELGADARRSQANFVLAEVPDPLWLRDALAGLGIGVRAFPGRPGLERAVRITCPGSAAALERVRAGLAAALAPEAVLFDLDGVLADVSSSYRRAIVETAAAFGVELTAEDVARAKARGDANCDWRLTRDLLAEAGVDVSLAAVTERFESLYQGTVDRPGLRESETLVFGRKALERVRRRARLAVVTGRPQADAERFLTTHGVRDLFEHVVAREDAPPKPDPRPVLLALEELGVRRAWMVGDTVDDVRAARAAGVVPLGVAAPGDDPEAAALLLGRAGAARVGRDAAELEELLS